jgi:hypothetical protein
MTAMARVSSALVRYSRMIPIASITNDTRFLFTPTIFTSLALPGALHAPQDTSLNEQKHGRVELMHICC